MHRPDRATIDFETRSACDIGACGSWRYSLDPTTEILCMAFRLPWWEKDRVELWHPAFPHLGMEEGCSDWDALADLFAWIEAGGVIEAHNAFFERGIWVNILVPQGWPVIDFMQWRCSAAKAASHALPRALEDAVLALRLPVEKDVEGHKLMKQMCKPRKPKKADHTAWRRQHDGCVGCNGTGKIPAFKKDGSPAKKPKRCPACDGKGHCNGAVPPMPRLYAESKEMLERLFAYCKVDVLAEEGVSERLDDLIPDETGNYMMDQVVNERGFMLDTEAVRVALDLVDDACVDMNAELFELTEGQVEKATQRARMMEWFESQGLDLPDTTKETIDGLLESRETLTHLPEVVWRGLEIMKAVGRSSTQKYVSMRDWVCPDSRVHGGLLYHGANTGRWSGRGVQPHNFVRGKIADMEKAWEIIKTRDANRITSEVTDSKGKPIGGVMDVLAHALRGAIIPTPGKQLYVADYASIEARVLLWAADDLDALGVFHRGEDIYCYMASDIFGYPCNKKDHPDERATGKIAVLGLGYQMGWRKFQETAADAGVTLSDEFAQKIVEVYREKFWRVKSMWWDMEATAIEAVESGERVQCGKVTWYTANGFLFCELPSGRCLAYAEPEIHEKATPWGEMRPVLTFMAIDGYTRKWKRQTTYGGMLVENMVQAISRDLMAEAMWRCEWSEHYKPVLSVHDELIAEAEIGKGNVKEFEKLMAECPDWAAGCPVEAEGWSGFRYRK